MSVNSSTLPSGEIIMDSEHIERFNDIGKSHYDYRRYRGLKLSNGLKVFLASDAETDKSAAALTVEVGSMSDPNDIPGLAHFCEHMLFLGTEKYPNENAYATYLSENGGSSNASTYGDNTKYYFDVAPNHLDGALDRFAQFFIAPLFTESATEREINAVDSEHDKNIATDLWRTKQVSKSLADPNHPYSKFGTGSKETLLEEPLKNGINVRDELIKFHDKWYSANIMSLAVFGKESLDDLEKMVVSKFSGIVNKNIEAPRWERSPYLPEHQASKLSIVPVKDSRSLTISFPTGDIEKHYKSAPEHYLSHLLGHEGKGSILSELKNKGWCNSLLAGHSPSARGFGFFDVSVDLTQEGFDNVNEIIKIIFQYINMLKTNEPKRWIFDEYCNLSEAQFRFKCKETPIGLVTTVVHSMQLYPMNEVLTAPFLISEFRPDLIKDLEQQLTPKNCRIIVVGQKLAPIANSVEKWYGTKYHNEKIDDEVLNEWSNCGLNPKLSFPDPNPFIPTDFDLLPIDKDAEKYPVIIHDTPVMRVWFKQDTEFLRPKALMHFDFFSHIAYLDPLNCNMTHMFVNLLRDQLREYLYEAELAGLKLNISNASSGMSLSISGYSDKQKVLLEKILDHIFSFEFDENRFEILKEQLARGLKNFKAEQPYQHAVYYLTLILTERAWSKEELFDAIKLMTVGRLRQYIKDFLSRLHVECFIYANVNRQKAMDVAAVVQHKLDGTDSNALPLLSRQMLLSREYKLVPGEKYLFEIENEYHKSSCNSLYLQCGPHTDRSNVLLELVNQILSQPFYHQLRTTEQLGYIVYCGIRNSSGSQGIRFIVQSCRNPLYVQGRIKVFLDSMLDQLTNMPDDEFERHKESLAAINLEKPKRLLDQFHKFMNEITVQQYNFERDEKSVAILRTVTKAEIIDFYKNYILFSGPQNCTLSMNVFSIVKDDTIKELEETEVLDYVPETDELRVITDLTLFKSSKELFALTKPYVNIGTKGSKSKL
ncbi:Insulin-degrading enzyme [Pseudolycoriella hygida]|uniref:Insulin-degrading enzyme n=1 Tax=Pseudolycoriella hygida TaxID=35572 RepID=A0A9Q0N8G3_9DIPT|nr:Insulin-degrading enzyme [Pseudolycoriella hygida]